MQGSILWIAVAGVALVVFIVMLRSGKKPVAAQGTLPYVARRLMTTREQQAFNAMKRALPATLHVHAQVQLSAIVGVKNPKENRAWFNKLSQKRVDFVVCDTSSTVRAVIELDDRSHDDPQRSKADQDKEAALVAAGIRLIRWNAAVLPSFDEIAADLGAETNSADREVKPRRQGRLRGSEP